MLADKGASLHRAVVPVVLDACGRLGAVVFPFAADNDGVAHKHIPVIFKGCCGSVYSNGPEAVAAPGHRIFLVLKNQIEALAPAGVVVN